MKKLKYFLNGLSVELPYTDANISIAENEADDGAYTIEDDGKTDIIPVPTESERLSALEAAMLELMGVTENG